MPTLNIADLTKIGRDLRKVHKIYKGAKDFLEPYRAPTANTGGDTSVQNTNAISATTYIKKKAAKPKTVKRKEAFRAKVENALASKTGTGSIVRVQTGAVVGTGFGTGNLSQKLDSWSLYGHFGSDVSNNDVQEIMITQGINPVVTGDNVEFHSATIEFQISALSTNTRAGVLDVYRVRPRKDIDSATQGTNAAVAWTTMQATDTTTGTAITTGGYGVTPFQSPQFCSLFEIEEKESHDLPTPNSIIKFSYVDKTKKRYKDIGTESTISLKAKWSTCWILVYRQVPTAASGSTVNVDAEGIQCHVVKTYKVTTPQRDYNFGNYLYNT